MSTIGVKRAHHFGVFCADEARSVEFYRDRLGGTVVHKFSVGPDKNNWLIDLGGDAVVELIPFGSGKADTSVGWVHIALEVEDTQKAYDACIAAGCDTWIAPTTEMDIGKPVCLAYVHGPDGEIIELYQEL
ncbi:MAG: VOC family protein [Oscillospiraceae bacterium]|jgi:catechol 2,3-dioxygenase-like lactoylglutathione lyase family enzyme|nr:VOC family protein [Oscillospiraceae bacterium]